MSASSPVSSLSSPPISEAGGDTDHENETLATHATGGPPAKKRRVTRPSQQSPPHSPMIKIGTAPDALPPLTPLSDVSSDDEEYLPGDANFPDEIALGAEQVRRCGWGSCSLGELKDQDVLVKHVHEVHVAESRATKYTCEWADCKARSKPQGSAYALRAHLRSHTKEKPFYCALPECDRSFTRSDALQKHMRTVHENENIKAGEHPAIKRLAGEGIPGSPLIDSSGNGLNASVGDAKYRSMNAKPPKSLKLVFGSAKSPAPSTPGRGIATTTAGDTDGADTPNSQRSPSDPLQDGFPDDLDFTAEESGRPRDALYRLLRQQIAWAEEEGRLLEGDIEKAEKLQKDEWLSKELILENLLEADFARGQRRGLYEDTASLAIESATGDADLDLQAVKGHAALQSMAALVESSSKLPLGGSQVPWYREDSFRQELKKVTEASAPLPKQKVAAVAAEAGADVVMNGTEDLAGDGQAMSDTEDEA